MSVPKQSGSRTAFLERLALEHPDSVALADRLVRWARANDVVLRWSSAATFDTMIGWIVLGVQEQKVFSIQTNGQVSVLFRQLSNRVPVASDASREATLQGLAAYLPNLPATSFSATKPDDKAVWPLSAFATAEPVGELLKLLEWMLRGLRAEHEDMLAGRRTKKKGKPVAAQG